MSGRVVIIGGGVIGLCAAEAAAPAEELVSLVPGDDGAQ